MPSAAKFGKREHPAKTLLWRFFDSLRCNLRWLDLFVGLSATLAITFIIAGFRQQPVPEYKVGSIADQDIRAPLDLSIEDTATTARRREAARVDVPALYEIDLNIIADREADISRAFEAAREILDHEQAGNKKNSGLDASKAVREDLERAIGKTFPSNIQTILLRQRFNPMLESQVLKVLDAVLKGGIVADKSAYVKGQRTWITLPDGSLVAGRPPADAYLTRDLPAAKEYLLQLSLEFSALSNPDRAALVRYLQSWLVPTLIYNDRGTRERKDAAVAQVAPVEIRVKKGQTIVRSGEEINQTILLQLEALRNLQKPRSLMRQFVGFFFFVICFVYTLWRYLAFGQKRHRKIRNHALLILVVIATTLLMMRLFTALSDLLSERLSIESFRDPINIYYAIPFAFGAVLVTLLVDSNLGIVTAAIIATLSGLFYGDIYIASYALIGSVAGIYGMHEYKDRAAILKTGLTIGFANIMAIVGIDLLRQAPVASGAVAAKAAFGLMGGIIVTAITSVLLPVLESVFKITTDIRLLELSNLNAPTLRRLSVEAPGTYHHSLMVGTLAESAAEAVGANPLLARVGAYYHDLGKMLKPEYFVENQIFGINKHETLSPSMSCLIIASHIKDGLELAKEIGLAERIRDMIPQHHGTRIMTYFFQKAKDALDAKNPEVIEADYRYPGPKPQSKEAAIIMMADSVEAASRTLSNPSGAQIQGMVNRLIDAIVADDQLDECDITMRDIRLVKESFVKVLMGLFHRRIDYPGYDFKDIGKEPDRASTQGNGPKQTTAV